MEEKTIAVGAFIAILAVLIILIGPLHVFGAPISTAQDGSALVNITLPQNYGDYINISFPAPPIQQLAAKPGGYYDGVLNNWVVSVDGQIIGGMDSLDISTIAGLKNTPNQPSLYSYGEGPYSQNGATFNYVPGTIYLSLATRQYFPANTTHTLAVYFKTSPYPVGIQCATPNGLTTCDKNGINVGDYNYYMINSAPWYYVIRNFTIGTSVNPAVCQDNNGNAGSTINGLCQISAPTNCAPGQVFGGGFCTFPLIQAVPPVNSPPISLIGAPPTPPPSTVSPPSVPVTPPTVCGVNGAIACPAPSTPNPAQPPNPLALLLGVIVLGVVAGIVVYFVYERR